MTTLDPDLRDLLTAVHDVLERPDWDPQASHNARAAIESVLRYPLTSEPRRVAAWLRDRHVEAADAGRVRAADRTALHLAGIA